MLTDGQIDIHEETAGRCLAVPSMRACELCRHALPVQPGGTERCVLVLSNRGPYTLEEIGQMMGLTRERIRQIEQSAMRKLAKRTMVKQIAD
jgi:hypothetical protein